MSFHRGFTLIEMLVVLLVMGLAMGAISLSVSGGSDKREITRYAEWFARQADMTRLEAEAEGRHHGAAVYRSEDNQWRWQWYRLVEGRWQLSEGHARAPSPLPEAAKPALRVEGEQLQLSKRQGKPRHIKPDIVIFSSGEITPFQLTLDYPNSEGISFVIICASAVGFFQVLVVDIGTVDPCEAA